MRATAFFALACLVAILAIGAAVRAEPPRPYVVIVHPGNHLGSVERSFLEDAFLKKVTRWPDDVTIKPVDLAPSSSVRRRFSEEVLRRSVEAVKNYWQQRIFSGRDVPPPELESDEAVVQYVLKHPGAIGYVSGAADLEGAATLSVR